MDLSVQTREITGKKVRALRKTGLIPAELYGHGTKNQHLSVSAKEFGKVFKEAGESTVITLVNGNEKIPAIINDVVNDPVKEGIAHIDFYQVRMDEKITATVPLEFEGVSAAIKEKGGVLNKSMNEIEVEAFPQDLPHRIVVDISLLDELNKSIYVRNLSIPKNVKLMVDEDTAVATATEPLPEEEAAAPTTDVADVKVETEEKKAERDAQKAEGAE